jgi:pyruvate/2-oxoglutarate dehydrogenase complex dihydrolipoamide dehydrogenase (E3) component
VYKGFSKPTKFDRNLIVIGAGSAGLVTAYIGVAVKAKVTLIEAHRMGGDCLNTGCVPSKALIRTAKLLHQAEHSEHYGVASMQAKLDFAQAMERVQKSIQAIEPHDSVERYTGLGVEVISGYARIVSPWEVEITGSDAGHGAPMRLSARTLVIATGAKPLVPNIPGVESVEPLTSDTVWSLRQLPKRLLVLGGGPIGCELAQTFARLGSEVILVEMAPVLLGREDPEVSERVLASLQADGVTVHCGCRAQRFEMQEGAKTLIAQRGSEPVVMEFDTVLLALGRSARVSGFGLEALGVRLTERKTVEVNGFLETNFPNIYAAGDVAGPYQFTHTAAHMAWYAAVNGLFGRLRKFTVDYSVIPWATFTDPEVARVGLNEREAREKGIAYEVTRYGLDDLDRAIVDGVAEGFVKVLTPPGSDRILGVTIVGDRAGDLIAEFVLAMRHKLGLNKILGTIHIYPTMTEANKYAAGVWKKANAPQRLLAWVERFHAWQRG